MINRQQGYILIFLYILIGLLIGFLTSCKSNKYTVGETSKTISVDTAKTFYAEQGLTQNILEMSVASTDTFTGCILREVLDSNGKTVSAVRVIYNKNRKKSTTSQFRNFTRLKFSSDSINTKSSNTKKESKDSKKTAQGKDNNFLREWIIVIAILIMFVYFLFKRGLRDL